MTDIVHRLRDWRNLHLALGGQLFEAAADEIERLRSGAVNVPGTVQQEPVAWAVFYPTGDAGVLCFFRRDAEDRATASDRVVPLYRSPTLTDAEREAVAAAIAYLQPVGNYDSRAQDTLRKMLERLR